ncbi:MAG: 2-oxoacid:acceptor oxidoreductase family protein [Candidatus Aminicenantes bacterium]|nr:MAG: 2-oxoacid:acceptor oxidoreductase family protein [Candidatus Aminicenantes bacterium]
MKRYEIRYAAVGGQGILTAGTLLVDIAVKKEDKFALESPTYTAAVRGGATKVDVIISDQKIIFPQASAIDFFVCTDQKPYNLYRSMIKDDAFVIIDTNLVKDLGDTHNWKLYKIPIINETKKQLGNIVLTSVVTLSLTQKLTGIIEYDNMVEYVRKWAPKDFLQMNLKAIEIGRNLV